MQEQNTIHDLCDSTSVKVFSADGSGAGLDGAAGGGLCFSNSPQLSSDLITRASASSHQEPRCSPPLPRMALILTS